MTAREQHQAVWKLLTRLDTLRIGLRDRASGGPDLVEELEELACACERIADDARTLACRLDEEAERGVDHAAE